MAKTVIKVPGMFEADEYGTPLAHASDIHDDDKNKSQSEINDALYPIDSVPTNDSNKPASSGSIFAALQALNEINATLSEDGKLYFDYPAGYIVYTESKDGKRTYWVSYAAGTADDDNPVDINALLFYRADNAVDAVRFSLSITTVSATEQQSLTDEQKAQAQNNIGVRKGVANGVASLNEHGFVPQEQTLAVRFNEQPLTDNQKVQALNNIEGKNYSPLIFSGLGKKILAKNIQRVDDIQRNIMTQAFFEDDQGNPLTNTVFVIKYDFTLGEPITIPANCVLKFDGGSISGSYTITGSNTGINAGLVKIFNTDVTLAGTWNIAETYPEWFGAKGDGVTDDRLAIQRALDMPVTVTTLSDKTYMIASYTDTTNKIGILIPRHKKLFGTSLTYYLGKSVLKTPNNIEFSIVVALDGPFTTIKNITVLGGNRDLIAVSVGTKNWANNICLDSIFVSNTGTGFDIKTYVSNITGCTVTSSNIGFYIHGDNVEGRGTSTTLKNCYVNCSKREAYRIERQSYSTLLNCAADACGCGQLTWVAPIIYDENFNGDYKGIYNIIDSNAISLISCGGEAGGMAVWINDCNAVSLLSCSIVNKPTVLEDSNFDKNKIIYFNLSKNCYIRNSRIGLVPENSSFISSVNSDNCKVEDLQYVDTNNIHRIIRYNALTNGAKQQIPYKPVKCGVTTSASYVQNIILNFNNSVLDKVLSISITQSQQTGLSCDNIEGTIIIDGTIDGAKGKWWFTTSPSHIISSCKKIIFKNFDFRFDNISGSQRPVFKVAHSEIEFQDCNFEVNASNIDIISEVFEIDSAEIKLINCTQYPTNVTIPFTSNTEGRLTRINTSNFKILYCINNVWVDATGATV